MSKPLCVSCLFVRRRLVGEYTDLFVVLFSILTLTSSHSLVLLILNNYRNQVCLSQYTDCPDARVMREDTAPGETTDTPLASSEI